MNVKKKEKMSKRTFFTNYVHSQNNIAQKRRANAPDETIHRDVSTIAASSSIAPIITKKDDNNNIFSILPTIATPPSSPRLLSSSAPSSPSSFEQQQEEEKHKPLILLTKQMLTNIVEKSPILLTFKQKLDIAISDRLRAQAESQFLALEDSAPLAICDQSSKDNDNNGKLSEQQQHHYDLSLITTNPTLPAPKQVSNAVPLKIGRHVCYPSTCRYERLVDVAQPGSSDAHLCALIEVGIIQNNETDPDPQDVWLCMQGGNYHDCRRHVCKDVLSQNGFYTCWKTHIIHDPDMSGTDHIRHIFTNEISHAAERVRDQKVAMYAVASMVDRAAAASCTDIANTTVAYNAPWKRVEREISFKKERKEQKKAAAAAVAINASPVSSSVVITVPSSSQVIITTASQEGTIDSRNKKIDEWMLNFTTALTDSTDNFDNVTSGTAEVRIAAEKVVFLALINSQSQQRQKDIIDSFSSLVMRGWFVIDVSRNIEGVTNLMRVELAKSVSHLDPKLSDTITTAVPPTTSSHERYFHQLWKVKAPRPVNGTVESDGRTKFSRFNKFLEIGIGTLFVASKGYESSADIMTLEVSRVQIDLFATALRRTAGIGLAQFAEMHKIRVLKKDPYLQKSFESVLSKKSYTRALNRNNNKIDITRVDTGSTAILSRLSAVVEWSKMKLLYDFFILAINIDTAVKSFDDRNITFLMN